METRLIGLLLLLDVPPSAGCSCSPRKDRGCHASRLNRPARLKILKLLNCGLASAFDGTHDVTAISMRRVVTTKGKSLPLLAHLQTLKEMSKLKGRRTMRCHYESLGTYNAHMKKKKKKRTNFKKNSVVILNNDVTSKEGQGTSP